MPRPLRRRPAESGLAIVVVLVMSAVLMALVTGLNVSVMQDTRLRGAVQRSNLGFYAAEAGVNHGMGSYKNIFLDWRVPMGDDFNPRTIAVAGREVSYQLDAVPGYPLVVTMPAGKPFAGLNATEYRYTANSTAHGPSGDAEATLGTEFDVDYIPLFQFLAFYAGDLEILPGPNMTVHGPMHTNGDLYLGSNNTLRVEDLPPTQPTVHVSASGMVFRGRKDRSECIGTVYVDALQDADADGSLDPRVLPCAGEKTTGQLAPWLGSLLRDQRDISLPAPDIIDRGAGEYWTRADLRIALDLDHPDANGRYPIVALAADQSVDGARTALLDGFIAANPGRLFYNDVPVSGKRSRNVNCGSPPSDSYCHKNSYAAAFVASGTGMYPCTAAEPGCMNAGGACLAGACFNAAYVTSNGNRRGGFYNNREQKWVYLLNLNLQDLLTWNMAQPAGAQLFDPADATEGGPVLFLTVIGPGSGGISDPRYGVRVFGSPVLPFPGGLADPTGVTLVSDQAFYVEGDYNVGQAGNPKQPAAVMADTLNVLSVGWTRTSGCYNDCQGGQTLGSRPALSTTINAAFLAGVDVTTAGNYNGGFENYPRFHETWSGTTLTYRGSFASLGTPRRANGAWCGTGGSSSSGCNIYNPPARNWDFDTDFIQVQNLPPMTPRFVLVQQILFTETFK